jgi:hypothetical protein
MKTAEQEACKILEAITNDDNGIDSINTLARLISDKRRLDWLADNNDTLSWDDADFWCVWDGKKAITGNTIREAIDQAMKEGEGYTIAECSKRKG